MSNDVLERIHQVLRNLVWNFNIYQTYDDKNYPWIGISAAAKFAIRSTTKRQIFYSPGQLVFGCDMILLIKHKVDWELIRQRKQAQINKYNSRKNRHRDYHDYKVGDTFILTKHTAYKYETPYKGPFLMTQCFTNGTVNLKCGTTQIKYNKCRIKP